MLLSDLNVFHCFADDFDVLLILPALTVLGVVVLIPGLKHSRIRPVLHHNLRAREDQAVGEGVAVLVELRRGWFSLYLN